MDTKVQMTTLQKEEAPPSYHSAVGFQPGGSNQVDCTNADFVAAGTPPVGAFGVSQPVGFVPPTGYPAGIPGPFLPASNILVGPAYYRNDLEVLSAYQKLTFRQDQTGTSPICQILGSQNQFVMSTLATTFSVPDHDGTSYHVSTTIKFSDPLGNVVITSLRTGRQQQISSGDRIIGVIVDSASLVESSGNTIMTGQNSNGDVVFQVAEEGNQYRFQTNGTTIAVAMKFNKSFGLEFTAPVDSNTRAMIIAGSYYLLSSYQGYSCLSGYIGLGVFMFVVAIIIIFTQM